MLFLIIPFVIFWNASIRLHNILKFQQDLKKSLFRIPFEDTVRDSEFALVSSNLYVYGGNLLILGPAFHRFDLAHAREIRFEPVSYRMYHQWSLVIITEAGRHDVPLGNTTDKTTEKISREVAGALAMFMAGQYPGVQVQDPLMSG